MSMGRGVEQTPNISVSEQLTAISVILQQIVSPKISYVVEMYPLPSLRP